MDEAFRARIEHAIGKRKLQGNYRSLQLSTELVDFFSNDYLGLARSQELQEAIHTCTKFIEPGFLNGSGGSRLLAGNHPGVLELEHFLAAFYQAPASLLFNSGYDANLAFFSAVPQRGDTVLYDELIHASVIDGARLGFARRVSFKHNDTRDLVAVLKQATGCVFVAVEALYSMTGDLAPLEALVMLSQEHHFTLIVDEAHSTGVFGQGGRGCFDALFSGDAPATDIVRLHTFGKAAGTHGAAFVLQPWLKEFIVNYARPFIYSTALPAHSLAAIHESHLFMEKAGEQRKRLKENLLYFLSNLPPKFRSVSSANSTGAPIRTIPVPGNFKCLEAASKLTAAGFNVRPIRSPTVPEGHEQLRICLHSFNSQQEILGLTQVLSDL